MRPGGSVALIGGRYELVAERGGDQEVVEWEGFDAALERRVRVRLLRQELVDDPQAVERFWTNARAQARGATRTGDRILDGGTDPETGRVYVVREWSADAPAAPRHAASSSAPARRRWRPGRPTFVAVLLVAGLACVLVLRSGVQGWLAWVNEPLGQVNRSFALPPATTPRPAPSVAPTQAAAAATAKPTAAPTPLATPTPNGVTRRVVNTDGRGVALRGKPGGDRLPGKGYDEGATVMAFETVGEWTRIKGGDGREGWVLSVTLAP